LTDEAVNERKTKKPDDKDKKPDDNDE